MNSPPIRLRCLSIAACCGLMTAQSSAQHVLRCFGLGHADPGFCSPGGDVIGPSELLATNWNGEVLVLGSAYPGAGQNGLRRGWGSNSTGVYAWPPSSASTDDCRDFDSNFSAMPWFHSQVSLGYAHAAAICDGVFEGSYWVGTVVCWGHNSEGQCEVAREPWGTRIYQVVQVACGGKHTLARRSNGHVRAWGSNSHGQSTVPPAILNGSNVNVVDVTAGALHSIARHADGRLTCWGAGAAGDPGDDFFRCGQANPPADLGPVTAAAAGAWHSVALRPDGTVACWGAGAIESNYNFHMRQSLVPADLGPVVKVSAGAYSTAALLASGEVRVWGWSPDEGFCAGACDVPAGFGNMLALQATYRGIMVLTDQPRPPCPEDLATSCNVDGADLGVLLASWGPATSAARADLDGDGVVDGNDLGLLLAAWGSCPD